MNNILTIIEMKRKLICDGYLKQDILQDLKNINPTIENIYYFLNNIIYKSGD